MHGTSTKVFITKEKYNLLPEYMKKYFNNKSGKTTSKTIKNTKKHKKHTQVPKKYKNRNVKKRFLKEDNGY